MAPARAAALPSRWRAAAAQGEAPPRSRASPSPPPTASPWARQRSSPSARRRPSASALARPSRGSPPSPPWFASLSWQALPLPWPASRAWALPAQWLRPCARGRAARAQPCWRHPSTGQRQPLAALRETHLGGPIEGSWGSSHADTMTVRAAILEFGRTNPTGTSRWTRRRAARHAGGAVRTRGPTSRHRVSSHRLLAKRRAGERRCRRGR